MAVLSGKLRRPSGAVRIAGGLLVLAVAVRLVAGCALRTDADAVATSGGHDHNPAAAAAPAKVAAPLTLAELTTRTGCGNLQVQGKGADYQLGSCQVGATRVTVATFAADAGAQAWLEQAQAYGGNYLVGVRWVVVADPELLVSFQGKVGGEIQVPDHQPH